MPIMSWIGATQRLFIWEIFSYVMRIIGNRTHLCAYKEKKSSLAASADIMVVIFPVGCSARARPESRSDFLNTLPITAVRRDNPIFIETGMHISALLPPEMWTEARQDTYLSYNGWSSSKQELDYFN